jgi:hypothetical protein
MEVPASTQQKHKSWRRAERRTSGHLASAIKNLLVFHRSFNARQRKINY